MVQQLTIKLSIEPGLCLASIDTDYGIYPFQDKDAIAIASFVGRYIDTDLEFPDGDTMGSSNVNRELVDRLLADTRNMLGGRFSEDEYRKTLAIIEAANRRGHLGVNKSLDIYSHEEVNIANNILQTREIEEVDLAAVTRQPKALYVYVALVAVGLISA